MHNDYITIFRCCSEPVNDDDNRIHVKITNIYRFDNFNQVYLGNMKFIDIYNLYAQSREQYIFL